MDLTLTIIEAPDNVNMLNHTKAFRAEGGTFGRSDNNTWVLPDNERVISSSHAQISFRDGFYYLTDTSTNGTFHNHEDSPIGSAQPRALADGDILTAGSYTLKVSVKSRNQQLPKGLQEADFLDSVDKTTFSSTKKTEHEQLSQAKELDDWLEPHQKEARVTLPAWGDTMSQPQSPSPLTPKESLLPSSGDPLSSFITPDNLTFHEASLDPLAAFDSADNNAAIPTSWDDDGDEWWKDGSSDDHAPATAQAFNASAESFSTTSPSPHSTTPQQPINKHQAWEVQPPVPAGPHEAHHQPPLSESASLAATQPSNNLHPGAGSPPQHHNVESQWDNQSHLQGVSATEPVSYSISSTSEARTQNTERPSKNEFQNKALQNEFITHSPQQPNPPASHPVQTSPVQVSEQRAQCSVQYLHNISQADQITLPLTNELQGHPATPQPTHPQSAASTAVELAAALGIAGLSTQNLNQLVPEATAIIHETVNRLIDLLRARSSIKNELRVQRTMIQVTDNNPLKFSVTAADALNTMFSAENQAFMRPQDAVSDSFDDLSDHQVAVLAGMRAAYTAMLKHFSPENLSQRFHNQGHLLSNKKAKDWESFESHFAHLLRDEESAYDLLFGDSFADTYEKQLSQLKTARALTKSNKS